MYKDTYKMIECPVCHINKFIVFKGIRNKNGKFVKVYYCVQCGKEFERKPSREERDNWQ